MVSPVDRVVEEALVKEWLRIDPRFLERLQLYVARLTESFDRAKMSTNTAPPDLFKMYDDIGYYTHMLFIALELTKLPQAKDDIFAEANKNAQEQEATKVAITGL